MKRWELAPPIADADLVALVPTYGRLLASLLWRRGAHTTEEAERFLNPDWDRDVHDPFLFKDMEKAVARILAAAEAGEKVTVHGDYDADGVSGSVILFSTLKKLGADVDVYLPHREKEGYGISESTVKKLAEAGTKVMITTDCGIASFKEITLAQSLGIDVIVTDHHTLPPELPPAHAILHPLSEGETYPFRHLTGGGVAFKLCQALWARKNLPVGQEKWLVDMVAISTVADMGALVGENRALVNYGLKVMAKTKRPGLAKLVEMAGTKYGLNAGTIGFQIAPRINAAGRMDHARGAFDLLVSENADDIMRHSMALDRNNLDRREATEVIVVEARAQASTQSDDTAIVVAGVGWPAALAGLVASRLMDDRHKPVIALGKNEEGNYVGSGRSIPGFDITAALRECAEHILKFGGHPRACGMTIVGDENFEAFKKQFKELAKTKLEGVELVPRLDIEEALTPSEAKLSVVESIRRLEPHGEGNPKPLFMMENVRVLGSMPIGDGSHLRMTLTDDAGGRLQCIGFRMAKRPWVPAAGDHVDAVVELDINEWNGTRSAQGKLVDFRQHI